MTTSTGRRHGTIRRAPSTPAIMEDAGLDNATTDTVDSTEAARSTHDDIVTGHDPALLARTLDATGRILALADTAPTALSRDTLAQAGRELVRLLERDGLTATATTADPTDACDRFDRLFHDLCKAGEYAYAHQINLALNALTLTETRGSGLPLAPAHPLGGRR